MFIVTNTAHKFQLYFYVFLIKKIYVAFSFGLRLYPFG